MSSKRESSKTSVAKRKEQKIPVRCFRVLGGLDILAGLLAIVGSIISLAKCKSFLYPNFGVVPGVVFLISGVLVLALSRRQTVGPFRVLFCWAIIVFIVAVCALAFGIQGITCHTTDKPSSLCNKMRPSFCGGLNETSSNQPLPLAANALVLVAGVLEMVTSILLCTMANAAITFLRKLPPGALVPGAPGTAGVGIGGTPLPPGSLGPESTTEVVIPPEGINIDIGNQNQVSTDTKVDQKDKSATSSTQPSQASNPSTQSTAPSKTTPARAKAPIQIAGGAPGKMAATATQSAGAGGMPAININISNINEATAGTDVKQESRKKSSSSSTSASSSKQKTPPYPASDSSGGDKPVPYPRSRSSRSDRISSQSTQRSDMRPPAPAAPPQFSYPSYNPPPYPVPAPAPQPTTVVVELH